MYGKAYTVQAVAKTEPTETIYTCEIWQKDFAGYENNFDPASNPFTGQILASSDDVYEPILTSTFTLLIDTTDFIGTLPNFVDNDDRKYWVKFYNSGTTYFVWQGFMIMQNVNIPFTTGRIFLQLQCIDGLALLKNIPYVPTNPDINVAENLSTTITNCLNLINLPNGYGVNYTCGIYAQGLDEGISIFKQAFYPPRNWLASAPSPTPAGTAYISPFMSSYDVLTTIMLDFGCQIFQSQGEWWIGNVNERAENSIRRFRTTNANGVETVKVIQTHREILPYADTTTTPWHFQDNVQAKILRKGYPYFELKCPAAYAPNMTDNGAMADVVASFPRNWGTIGIAGVTFTTLGPYNAINLAPTGGSAPLRTVGTFASSNAPVYIGDSFSLNFLIDGQATISATPKCQVQIFIQTAAAVDWYMDTDGNWSLVSGKINIIGSTTGVYESKSLSSKIFPVSGTIRINYFCDNFDTLDCTIANQQLTFQSAYDYRIVRNPANVGSYKKQVQFQMGGPSDQFNPSQKGSLLDSSGAILQNWYRYQYSESFADLTSLIAQQYYNVQSRSVINFSMTTRNLLDLRSKSLPPVEIPHVIGPIDNLTVQDTTGTTLSVDGLYYLIGASDFNYIEDTLAGTILQSSNVDLSVTFTDNLIVKS